MSTLYIAATALQLIAILNIRVNMNGKKGDLIIHEKSILNSHYIKERIVESGLFLNIIVQLNQRQGLLWIKSYFAGRFCLRSV